MKLEILKISDVITAPWDQVESPKFKGYAFGVARKLSYFCDRIPNENLPHFNCYAGYYEFVAMCTTVESAEAAKRLLSD